ncbi:purine-cytosine permease family protein [Pseudomonas taiwanensis]|uniref:Allantoin permease n=1 Tax=Pseudomonas taiwanensis TaxID=470150 RepID=A0ABR6VC15_9PSED|nr:allantoin permease [Pseudomonas taiwanensis]MBC3478026.1 allantoin permease [Pseudomonas taiwanensis]
MVTTIKSPEDAPDISVIAVPDDQRMGKFSLTMAWWAVSSGLFFLVVPATLAIRFGTMNAIIGLLLSAISYGLLNSIIARFAIRTGLSGSVFSRILFGRSGSTLATLIFFVTVVYYCVFEGSVIAIAIKHYFSQVSLDQAYLIVVVYSVILIMGSIQNWLDKLNMLLMPIYLVGLAAVVWIAISKFGYNSAWLDLSPASGPVANGWWDCFTYYMGVWVLMLFTWDYARFGRKEDTSYHASFNFGIPFYLLTFVINGVVGIFLAATIATQGEISEVSVVLAIVELMGFLGLLFVWVSQTRINTANFFLAATNLQTFLSRFSVKLPYVLCAVISGIAVYGLMRLNVFHYILQALAYQSIFVVAWVSVALAHILSPKYRELFGDVIEYQEERIPAYNPGGLAAWLFAAFVGMVLLNVDNPAIASFSAPASFLTAFLTYWLLLNSAKRHWFATAN